MHIADAKIQSVPLNEWSRTEFVEIICRPCTHWSNYSLVSYISTLYFVGHLAAQLRNWCEHAKVTLSRRRLELEDMLLDYRQFNSMVDEFEQWVSIMQRDCDSQAAEAAAACTVPTVEKLIVENKVLNSYPLSFDWNV